VDNLFNDVRSVADGPDPGVLRKEWEKSEVDSIQDATIGDVLNQDNFLPNAEMDKAISQPASLEEGLDDSISLAKQLGQADPPKDDLLIDAIGGSKLQDLEYFPAAMKSGKKSKNLAKQTFPGDAREMQELPSALRLPDGKQIDCSDLADSYNLQLADDLARRQRFEARIELHPDADAWGPPLPDDQVSAMGSLLSDEIAQLHRGQAASKYGHRLA